MPRSKKKHYNAIECRKCGGRHPTRACTTECYRCHGPHYVTNCPEVTGRGGGGEGAAKRQKKSAWEGMKVTELKVACRDRELHVSGRKAELVARLDEYLTRKSTTGIRPASRPGTVVVAPSSGAFACARAKQDDVYALFDVEDDSKDVAMANAVSTFELSQSTSRTSGNKSFPPPRSDLKPAALCVNIMGSITAPSSCMSQTSKFSSLSQTSSQTTDVSSLSSSCLVPSSAPKPELSQDQKERMRRNREEAHKKKMARLSAASMNAGRMASHTPSSTLSQNQNGQAVSQSPPRTKRRSSTFINPYLQRSPILKRDESKPDDAVLFGCGQTEEWRPTIKTLDDLPPLPPDAPPVREDTLNRLSEQQMQVIMAARPPPPPPPEEEEDDGNDKNASATNETMHDTENTSCVNKNLFPQQKQPTTNKPNPHHMIRVNAAAGTGKTTTLLHLATRCIDLGHKSLTYVTYSRASAKDAQDRMQGVLDEEHKGKVGASTLHSCAMRLLKLAEIDHEHVERERRPLDETQFKSLIQKEWRKDLDDHLEKAIESVRSKTPEEERHKLDGKEKLLEEKALHLLFKTFENFTRKRMSLEVLKDPKGWGRDYWPIKMPGGEFQEGGAAAKLGFPPDTYSHEKKYCFYANTCVKIWTYVVENQIRTFDIDLKKAQLQKLRIPCSVLLVDECQDLDECQVDWIEGQKQFGTHIFFVGDSAQCIFGFRGAKSLFTMRLDCIDFKLTKSWRFGPNIAKIANIPLFAKEKSEQTTKNQGQKRLWIPYRVQGARREGDEEKGSDSGRGGVVTTKSLLQDWQTGRPLTLIGRTNAGLMMKALDLLGLEGLKNDAGADGDAEDELASAMIGKMENLPKFHVNGKGDTSGASLWRNAMKQIRHLYELYTNRDEMGFLPMALPAKEFKEFANEGPMTWESFNVICEVREIARYNMALRIVSTYQTNTPKAMAAFESHVIAKISSVDDADIILTTCHSAKGLEWDNVEICDDILDLSAASFTNNTKSMSTSLHHPSFLKKIPGEIKSETPSASLEISKGDMRKSWQFILSSYQDADINMLYVASTRAKKILSVPASIKMLLQDFDRLHYLVSTFKKDASGLDGRKVPLSNDESMMVIGSKKLNKGEVWNLYHDLCYPLRKELGVPDDCMILPTLFPDCEDESMEIKFEGEQGEFEVKSERQTMEIKSEGEQGKSNVKPERQPMGVKSDGEQGESELKPERQPASVADFFDC